MAPFWGLLTRATATMATTHLTPVQQDNYHEDRRPALYVSLTILLVILNLVAPLKFFVHFKIHYNRKLSIQSIFIEDWFLLLGTVWVISGMILYDITYNTEALVNVIIASLITCTIPF